MRNFDIDDDVVALFSELAKPEPFESLSSALRRFLTDLKGGAGELARTINSKEPPRTAETQPNFEPSGERMRAARLECPLKLLNGQPPPRGIRATIQARDKSAVEKHSL